MDDISQQRTQKHHVNLYNRYPVTLAEGEGVFVKDTEGKEYIDAMAGIAVNSLGHCHPRVVEAIQKQAAKLMHISNFYYSEPQSLLVEKLAEISGLDQAFLCNSGVEAIEGAVKLARKYGSIRGKSGNIITLENCFHGRTLAAIAMGKKKYQQGFDPLPTGFEQVPADDIDAMRTAVDSNTVAVILEPVQGEGGIHPAKDDYMHQLRSMCEEHEVLLIVDEIQTGIGRTGKMFAYQHYDIKPDIVASAKALGNGFPIGAVITRNEVAHAFEPGNHGTTYGGNPLACAAAYATLSVMEDENIPQKAAENGAYFLKRLSRLSEELESIKKVRGRGLMLGVEIAADGRKVVEEMLQRGVLSNFVSGDIIRFVPPLIITRQQIDRVIEVFAASLKSVAGV